ncbi:C40 family peptidase [Levilactobacillus suantsaii]|uniref:Peptidoglycan endopeptidase n=1 Tax=Levilactobacillus suantsaii TaxID=2292255 RepID=A0A4Q0VMK4_9LACO|nr:C40 family peptidase [Levilactobacillus suantsaii]RXI80031.1 peptidoglycan endopeptidase [Levilactobacillus suantsaii]
MAGTQANASTVNVQSGDTVWGFSQAYHVSIKSIVKANSLSDANLIYVNQKLSIPDNQKTTTKANTTSQAATTSTTTSASSAAQSSSTQSTANSSSAAKTATSATQASKAAAASSAAASSAAASSAAASSAAASSAAASSAAASSAAQSVAASSSTATQASSVASSSSAATQYNHTATTASSAASSAKSTTSSSSNTSSSSASTSSTKGGGVAEALKIANSDVPYVYGGNSMSGFDCSGLVQYVFGLSARTTIQQAKLGTHHTDVANAPYGAILFWGSDSTPYHDGISLGNGKYVAAQNESDGIDTFTQNSYFKPSYYIVL